MSKQSKLLVMVEAMWPSLQVRTTHIVSTSRSSHFLRTPCQAPCSSGSHGNRISLIIFVIWCFNMFILSGVSYTLLYTSGYSQTGGILIISNPCHECGPSIVPSRSSWPWSIVCIAKHIHPFCFTLACFFGRFLFYPLLDVANTILDVPSFLPLPCLVVFTSFLDFFVAHLKALTDSSFTAFIFPLLNATVTVSVSLVSSLTNDFLVGFLLNACLLVCGELSILCHCLFQPLLLEPTEMFCWPCSCHPYQTTTLLGCQHPKYNWWHWAHYLQHLCHWMYT